ncbi:MAG: exodeoxyribonuclease V subunit gamma [Planctomycetes bacterium]|nr:exodeoxyribonuclease V subunit gamma [Planctomycetota bacterium]
MLRVVRGNDVHAMADRLAALLRLAPRTDPLQGEWILIGSPAMRRWLSIELARPGRLGAFGNGLFLGPDEFLDRLFRLALGRRDEEADPWAPPLLTWRVHSVLSRLEGEPAMEALRRFLDQGAAPGGAGRGGESDYRETKRYQVARRVAALFDRYATYRGDWLASWSEAPREGEGWLAPIWRALAQGHEDSHRAARWEVVRRSLGPGEPPAELPGRVTAFAVSGLPALHLEVLGELARRMDVHLFLLVPGRALLEPASALRPDGIDEVFREPRGGGLLAEFQKGLDLGPGADEAGGSAPRPLALGRADRSLQVHACHGPLREVEVLHDALLDLFAADPTLCPEEVAVFTTDIETYAPLVDAVFQQPGEGVPAIPYRILDRGVHRESPLVETLLRLLWLPGGRLEATRVLGLLDSAPLRRRFGLDEGAVETLRGWVRDAGIRWGWDLPAKRALLGTREGYEGMEANTWQQGLDRLFLGVAMSARHSPCLEREGGDPIPPLDGVWGGAESALGALREILEAVRVLREEFAVPCSLAEWASRLEAAVARFLECDEDSRWELRALRGELELLRRAGGLSGPGPVALEAVRGHLEGRLGERLRGRSPGDRGVSFASPARLRGVPFRVVGLLGMNDDAFPGREDECSFDGMAADRRPGDPDPRADARRWFLEALALARDAVFVSYVGADPQDASERPPSVVVYELLEALRPRLGDAGGGRGRSHDDLVRHHPLNPFHRVYFVGGGTPETYSYSREHEAACRASLAARGSPEGLFAGGALPAPTRGEGLLDVTPADLASYFRNPAAYLLTRRLGLRLDRPEEAQEDLERFDLEDHLVRWGLATEAIERLLEGMEPARAARLLRVDSRMPHGPAAARVVEEFFGGGEGPGELVEFVHRFRTEGLERPLELPRGPGRGDAVELPGVPFGEVVIAGPIQGVWAGRGVHRYRYAKGKNAHREKDRLDTLVGVLLLALHGGEASGRLVFRDSVRGYRASAPEARSSLETLVRLYEQGLRAPLPYIDGCSMSYHRLLGAKGEGAATHEFRRLWLDWDRDTPPRRDDAAYALAFAEEAPFRDGLLEASFVDCIGTIAGVLDRHES